jgi:hypothetical protein
MSETYELADDGRAIICLRCGLTSYNAGDIENRYCGHCNLFHEPEVSMVAFDEGQPLPAASAFGGDWPIIRACLIARVRRDYPDHPWLKDEAHAE